MTRERVIGHPQFTSKVDGEAGDVSKDGSGRFPAVKEGGSALPALLPTSFHHGNQVKWRRRPIIPDLADAPRPSFLSLPESLRTRVVLWKSVSPPSAKRHRTTAAAAIAAAQSSFTEFKTCCLICVDSTERERGLFSAHSFSLPQPFSVSPILQSFPRGVERATERWGKGAMERAGGQTGAGGRASRRGGQRPRRRSQLGLPARRCWR